MADKKPKQESVSTTTSTSAQGFTLTAAPMEGQDMFERIFNRIAERSKALKDLRSGSTQLRKELEAAQALLATANEVISTHTATADAMQVAIDLAEERKTQREDAYTAQREAEARAEHAEGVLERFRALPEFADLFGEDET